MEVGFFCLDEHGNIFNPSSIYCRVLRIKLTIYVEINYDNSNNQKINIKFILESCSIN